MNCYKSRGKPRSGSSDAISLAYHRDQHAGSRTARCADEGTMIDPKSQRLSGQLLLNVGLLLALGCSSETSNSPNTTMGSGGTNTATGGAAGTAVGGSATGG